MREELNMTLAPEEILPTEGPFLFSLMMHIDPLDVFDVSQMKIRSSSPVVDKSFLKSLYFKTVSKLSKL
jgi:hypothetical protein